MTNTNFPKDYDAARQTRYRKLRKQSKRPHTTDTSTNLYCTPSNENGQISPSAFFLAFPLSFAFSLAAAPVIGKYIAVEASKSQPYTNTGAHTSEVKLAQNRISAESSWRMMGTREVDTKGRQRGIGNSIVAYFVSVDTLVSNTNWFDRKLFLKQELI